MTIGVVNFLNAYPLYWDLQFNKKINLVRDIPSKLAEGLKKKELDIAIVSSIEYFKNKDQFSYFKNLCIAATGKVESIRLFLPGKSSLDLDDFILSLKNKNEVIVFYDRATRSSINMLRVLFYEIKKDLKVNLREVHPPFKPYIQNLNNNDLLLLIGDSALSHRADSSLDMGELYHKVFKRAFVYAIWVCQKDVEKSAEDLLFEAYKKGQEDFEEMVRDAVNEFKFSEEFTRNYLSNTIQYRLTDKYLEDMNFFFEKTEEIIPL